MTTSPDQSSTRPQDMRRWVFRFLLRSYAIGPDGEGDPQAFDWLADIPPDVAWSPEQAISTIGFLGITLVRLCHEVDAAQAEGRAVYVAGFLSRWELYLSVSEAAQAEGVSIQEILERAMPGLARYGTLAGEVPR